MALTLEELFKVYSDPDKDLAEEIYKWFGGDEAEASAEQFAREYGMYFPEYDPTGERFAFQDKYMSFKNAAEVHNLAKKSAEEVYSQEMQSISGGLEKEISKGKQVSGEIGLRSGTLESALADTMTTASNKAEDLGDRLLLQKEEDVNTYDVKMTDATLDFEKADRESKQEHYDRIMAAIMRLVEQGVFPSPVRTGGEHTEEGCIAAGCTWSSMRGCKCR